MKDKTMAETTERDDVGMEQIASIDGETRFRMVGPNLIFPDLTVTAGSLREAIRITQGDLVREAIGYNDPMISLKPFDVMFSIYRTHTDIDANEGDAHFLIDVTVKPPKDENWSGYEAEWWKNKYGSKRDAVTGSFIVYGDDQNMPTGIMFSKPSNL